ncbi:MAG: hypothetical protein AB1772_12340 [Candidatus Zixiibacteriota bacterium]
MSRNDTRIAVRWWEYIVWLLVTIPLLLIGAVLWVFSLVVRLVRPVGKRRRDD